MVIFLARIDNNNDDGGGGGDDVVVTGLNTEL